MRRRDFITLVSSVAAGWPLAARAQQAMRSPTIGVLGVASASAWRSWVEAFVQRLGELGWVEGRTVAIEFRWAEGRSERFAEIAAELVRLKVDVIVTAGAAVAAAKQATTVIPIVFVVASDPVGSGFVTSLARPGGNVSGLSVQAIDLVGKRVALLRELVPNLGTLAIMANDEYGAAAREMSEARAVARSMGLETIVSEIHSAEDIAHAFEALAGHWDALYVCIDPLTDANRAQIGALALDARLPTISSFSRGVEKGPLISYGPSITDLYRRAADMVDKILRGTKPGDIPVEQPTKFELVVNLRTAKALGIAIPPSILSRADEVIE
jgi:putative ABC transport system substrate-binding protein